MAEKETEKKELKKEKKVEKPAKEKKPRFALRKKKEVVKKEEEKMQKIDKKYEKGADPLGLLRFVLMTEKSIRMIEAENKLIFIVDRKSTKNTIKEAFEKSFDSPVAAVKTQNDQKGRKRAFIKLKNPGAAGEIAIRLGII
jgi:large subunit ribosomal protein L23